MRAILLRPSGRRVRYNFGVKPQSALFEVVHGDITQQRVDAIVNAANESLRGGGGVDGAIHRAAGPELLAECITVGVCPTGSARVTGAYRLPARFVIHTVGPVWHGGTHGEADQLASCYRSVIAEAGRLKVRSLAFPSISTGAYGYPISHAARLAVATVREAVSEVGEIELVRFVCFSASDCDIYRRVLGTGEAG